MANKREPFQPNTVYHVYNHGNADDNVFNEEENYHYFLKRFAFYIYPIAKTYAFCLLPNHFHIMVKVRTRKNLTAYFKEKYPEKDPQSFRNFADLLSNQFKNFLISYAKSFNNKYDRKGSLFLDNINRKSVKNDLYYKSLITYIHQNPVGHGLVNNLNDWPFNSYHLFLSNKQTKLEREKALDWFGGVRKFVKFHQENREIDPRAFY